MTKNYPLTLYIIGDRIRKEKCGALPQTLYYGRDDFYGGYAFGTVKAIYGNKSAPRGF